MHLHLAPHCLQWHHTTSLHTQHMQWLLTIFNGVLHCPEAIMHSVLDLCDRVLVGSFDKYGDRLGVLYILNEGKLVLALEKQKERGRERVCLCFRIRTLSLTNTCSYTTPACPRQSGVSSSNELSAIPPQASTNLRVDVKRMCRIV